MILHGGGRTTKDIDFLVDPSPDNIACLKAALSILEDNAAADIASDDLERYSVVRVADEVMVDLLCVACGVTWIEAQATALSFDLDGTQVRVAVWRGSDIDVGVLPGEPLPLGLLTELRARLENSTILPKVDVVNLRQVDPDFRERVLRDGIPWMA